MKDAYYFSHDCNARNDEKILELRAELGWEGYGIFWAIIECLREASDYKYSLKRLNGLALQLTTTKIILEQVIFNYGLFNYDAENFWSESLLRRMEERDNKTRKAKESAQKRWDEYYAKQGQSQTTLDAEISDMRIINNANANLVTSNMGSMQNADANVQTSDIGNMNSADAFVETSDKNGMSQTETPLFDSYANALQTHSESSAIKGKESKGKEIKEKEIINSSPPKSVISEEGEKYAEFFKGLLPPTQKVTEADLKNWGDTFDKLIRIDKRAREEIYQVTEWARKDSFWCDNFLSACKLRNKSKDGVLFYDLFLQKCKHERNKTNGTANNQQYQRPAWITGKE